MARDLSATRDGRRADSFWFERDTTPSKIEAAVRELQIEHAPTASTAPCSPRACSTSSPWSTGRGAARSRTASSGVGRYHAVAHGPLRGGAAGGPPSTRASSSSPTRSRRRARSPRRREHLVARHRRAAPRAPRLDHRPARRHRPADDAVVAARPLGRRRRAARPRPGRAPGLRRRAGSRGGAAPRVRAVARASTSSIWPGCAPRRGASASPRASIRRGARAQLPTISSVKIRHHPESAVAGVLLFGWLASRLGWTPARWPRAATARSQGRARTARARSRLALSPDPSLSVPRPGRHHDRDRPGHRARSSTAAPGGLHARR